MLKVLYQYLQVQGGTLWQAHIYYFENDVGIEDIAKNAKNAKSLMLARIMKHKAGTLLDFGRCSSSTGTGSRTVVAVR